MNYLKLFLLALSLFYSVQGMCETVRCAQQPGCTLLPAIGSSCCNYDCCTGVSQCGECLSKDNCAWCPSSAKGPHCIKSRHARKSECSQVLFESSLCPASLEVTCDYNSKVYHAGDSFRSSDDCNSCSCLENGQVACTEMYCPPPNSCSTQEDCANGWCRSGSCVNFQSEGGNCGGEASTEERCDPLFQCVTNVDDPNSLGTCQKQCDLVNCLVDPCTFASCPGQTGAGCIANYCGGCNAEWWVGNVKLGEKDCQASTGTHQGVCPPSAGDSFGVCVDSCSSDDGCSSDEKCCSNGCGNVCTKVTEETKIETHSGTCPELSGSFAGSCIESCSSDETCALDEKCCSNGCGHACTKVTPVVHEGTCPEAASDSFGICLESCSSDEGCNSDEKCCSTGCGHACTKVVSSPSICSLPSQTGPCKAYFPRYFYNETICEEFIYGGCGGNENNFETYEACVSTCGSA